MRPTSIKSFVLLLSLLTAQTNFSQWQQTAMTTGAVASLGATQTRIYTLSAGGIYSTTNNGALWIYANKSAEVFCTGSTTVFSSGNSEPYMSKTTDNGASWHQTGNVNADGWFSMTASGNNTFASRYVIQRSTNGGESWQVLQGIGSSWMECMAANGTLVFALAEHKYLYRSTNNGDNWTLTSFPLINVNAVAINGTTVFTATEAGGVYISTNSGETWTQTSLTAPQVRSLAVSGNNVFAGTVSQGVYCSNNSGATWVQKNEGLTNMWVSALLINGNNVYLGTGGNGVWKRSLSELVGINTISTEIPKEYSLSQNYPNPFNPTTNIKFSLPVNGFTTLNIYDAAGKLVNPLVNSELKAGVYHADFNASNLASGIYFYTLSSADFIKTNKMILVK